MLSSGLRQIIRDTLDQARTTVDGVLKAFRDLREGLRKSGWLLLGDIFIGLWWVFFNLRLVIAPAVPKVFIAVSGLDFLMLLAESRVGSEAIHAAHSKIDGLIAPGSSLSKIDGWIHVHNQKFLIAFSVASILLALVMVWHHHRVAERVGQHIFLLSTVRHIATEATSLDFSTIRSEEADIFITGALRGLTEATTRLKGSRVKDSQDTSTKGLKRVAVILMNQAGKDWFEVTPWHWPPDTFKDLPPGSLKMASAAGKALEKPGDTQDDKADKGIVYIPWTLFPHGTRLRADETRTPSYCVLDYVRNAFAKLGTNRRAESQVINHLGDSCG
jgi:hypothetical protein